MMGKFNVKKYPLREYKRAKFQILRNPEKCTIFYYVLTGTSDRPGLIFLILIYYLSSRINKYSKHKIRVIEIL